MFAEQRLSECFVEDRPKDVQDLHLCVEGDRALFEIQLRVERAERHALKARIRELEARLIAVEARPAMEYRGVWEARAYPIGSFVTYGGSCWAARAPAQPEDKPGASTSWQLAVKKGRDAQ